MREKNYHSTLVNNLVQPHFEKLEEHLIEYIEKATYVIGCVAWLTNPNIIEALENTKGVKIIINKEEYLNSNMQKGQKFFYKCLRGKYNEIPDLFNTNCFCCKKNVINCPNFNKIFSPIFATDNLEKKICDDNRKNGAILTCGIVNNFSKMHHKFLIFFSDAFDPIGLWTGSYNLSKTSNFSLENALYITDKYVINEYIKEFYAIYSFSESYNWKSGVLCTSIKN
ncbi:putative phospholipase D/nuclease [Tupanvirus deep ocean]|uniref:Phospholipase D/nuclease n=2 Tax=Tupanvirus TaxID=2094720 RepID=A0AC62A867_9VIRU|nr:putative phospholipase D/nuclease [Tupanvirus deep ocean]QKU33966.1 putative phospholipase D/nuclease [Tupanvirus deep ocean]